MDYNAMGEQLNGEYKDVFEKAELYGVVNNVAEDVREDLMMNLFDLLLTAQSKNKNVKYVIGNSVENFCEDYYNNYNWKERVKRLPEYIYRIVKFIFIFELLDLVLLDSNQNLSIFEAKSDLLPYIGGLCIGWLSMLIAYLFIKPIMFKKGVAKARLCLYIVLGLQIVACILGTVFLSDNRIMFRVYPGLLITGLYIIIYVVGRSVWRKKTYGYVRKHKEYKGEYEFSFKNSFKLSNYEFAKELEKRYIRTNKILKKFRKKTRTPDKFTTIIRKEIENEKKYQKWMILLYIVIAIAFVVSNIIMNGIVDSLFFAAVLIPIEGIVYYFVYYKLSNFSMNAKKALFEEIDDLGLNIIEYVEMKRNSEDSDIEKRKKLNDSEEKEEGKDNQNSSGVSYDEKAGKKGNEKKRYISVVKTKKNKIK